MTQQRRHFSPEQKVALLRLHLVEKVPISEVCEKNGIAVNLFYLWQKTFFENGTSAFQRSDDPQPVTAAGLVFAYYPVAVIESVALVDLTGVIRRLPAPTALVIGQLHAVEVTIRVPLPTDMAS
jgi:transposase-like protein